MKSRKRREASLRKKDELVVMVEKRPDDQMKRIV